jgi:DNA-binding NtrC family response regulator
VQKAYSVVEARSILAESPIGIIITDFRMPKGGLLALLSPIPERKLPPYVVLSGESHPQLPQECSPEAIFAKPVDISALTNVISLVQGETKTLARVA